MKLYQENKELICQAQNEDPLLNHITDKICSYLPEDNGKKLLDIGCGSGRLAFTVAKKGYQVTGIDLEKKQLP